MSTPSLPLLTAANWYLWEQQALNSMSIFGHAGHSIQTNTPFILNEPCKPLRMFYLEEVLDPDTQMVVVQQSSRPWNDATDWPLYNKAKEDYHSALLQYQKHRQSLWSFLLTHIDADVDHLIKLHLDYPQAALDIDTDKLWIILRQSVTQHGSFNVSEIKIEWANYKQSTYDLQGNVMSTIPLAKYLFRFQNFVDNFRGHPNRPTDLECTETLLAGINSRRYTYIWHKYYGTTAIKPTYANLKAELLQSEKNQVPLTEDLAVSNIVTVSSTSEPSPVALVATSSSMDPLNPQLTPLQPLQCAMCGQLKFTHPSGSPVLFARVNR